MSLGEFDRLMHPDIWPGDSEHARQAARVVGDTVLLCAAWWQQYGEGIKPTAGDLLKMCEMMLRLERKLERAQLGEM